jgi:UDP-GlcNAc:undecaprenyl-phosphate/decaprenyl-phosphate GlcNAc-1-phosphate transferase
VSLIFILIVTVVLSYFLTSLVRSFAIKNKITDDPKSDPKRKKQKLPVPLIGQLSFTFATILTVASLVSVGYLSLSQSKEGEITQTLQLYNFTQNKTEEVSTFEAQKFILASIAGTEEQFVKAWKFMFLEADRLFWIFICIVILTIGGFLDDKYHFSPKWQVVFIVSYISIAVFGAKLVITNFSYPFNQVLPETYWFRALFSFAWIGLCVAATKFLDGLDGLVSIVGFAGFLLVAAVSFSLPIPQPVPAILALIWVAALLGFLPYNFPNAKMYLGEGGSEIIGFLLGVLSLWSGAKVATVSMGLGIFIFDWFLVMFMRVKDKRNPLTSSDRFHWHHRLFDLGMTKIQVLASTSLILVIFGTIGLNTTTAQKPVVIFGEMVVLISIFIVTNLLNNKIKEKNILKSDGKN